MRSREFALVFLVLTSSGTIHLARSVVLPPWADNDKSLSEYFRQETSRLRDQCLADINSLEDWEAKREEYRQQLFEMLGLSPLPQRTSLAATITGSHQQDEFRVEKLHFQSLPGLYVTANLYLPKNQTAPAPAILYACGHARVVTNGTSYGNKTAYQHHPIWFARHGYVCLVIDTLQLGEIEGLHHGTYREQMWWWNSRGYTPAGVEAWNCIRALDYLESRPEVNPQRLGVTGRSGGGAYSWWLAALDDRIKVVAPVAGITDLENHVVDGTVEGHCDCMFFINTYRWDYPTVAALVAPRPLLVANSDKDSIFPLSGVQRVHWKVRDIYALYRAESNLGLLITEGPHEDTQDLQLPVFRWFNRHLKSQDPVIDVAATKMLAPADLKVFDLLPSDERNRRIQESFVPMTSAVPVPSTPRAWEGQRQEWLQALREKCFAGWPAETNKPPQPERLASARSGNLRLDSFRFMSQTHVPLHFFIMDVGGASRAPAGKLRFKLLDESGWANWLKTFGPLFPEVLSSLDPGRATSNVDGTIHPESHHLSITNSPAPVAYFCPRGIGPARWSGEEKKQVQIQRRFMLLGQTLDGMRVWDIRRAMQAIKLAQGNPNLPLIIEADGTMGVNAIYASLFEPGVEQLVLQALPASHQTGPDYLNVLKILDVPQAVAMAATTSTVVLEEASLDRWEYPRAVAEALLWGSGRFTVQPGAGQ